MDKIEHVYDYQERTVVCWFPDVRQPLDVGVIAEETKHYLEFDAFLKQMIKDARSVRDTVPPPARVIRTI